MRFSKRMQHFQENVFTTLLKMKQEKMAAGEEVIDLSVGTPNIPPADHIIEAMREAVGKKENYVYAISDLQELDEAAAQWYARRYGVNIDPKSEVVSLLGSQEGLAHISLSIVDEGDVVLVPDPCYPVFADGPVLAGASLHYMPLKKENHFLVDFSKIPVDVAEAAKLMIVSYPNNPTTAVATPEFYRELIAFAKKFDIIVLHDNAYSELVFDEESCGSFLAFEGAKEVGVEFNSLSKTYGLAGARVGFCIGSREVVANLKRLKSNMDYGMFIPVQKAAIAAITGPQDCVLSTRKAYRKRRDLLCDGFSEIGWEMKRCPATMFVWAKIPAAYKNSEEFVKIMIQKAGVMVTPGSAFGPSGEGFVRLALVQDEKDIKTAIEKVKASGIIKSDDCAHDKSI